MDRHRRNPKKENAVKLEEFPDDFTDVYFHNYTVEQDKKISVLRNIVYKKIKNAIIDRVAAYKDYNLEDKFTVDFNTEGFTVFQWAVMREELNRCGLEAEFILDEEEDKEEDKEEETVENSSTNKLKQFCVTVERSISLDKKYESDKEEEENDE